MSVRVSRTGCSQYTANGKGGRRTNPEGYHSIPIATSHCSGKNAHTRYMTYATKLPMYSTNPCDSTVGAGSVGSRGGNWAGREDEERSIGAEVMMVAGSVPDFSPRAGTEGRLSLLLLLSLVRWSRSRDEVERETEGEAGRERERRTGRNRALRRILRGQPEFLAEKRYRISLDARKCIWTRRSNRLAVVRREQQRRHGRERMTGEWRHCLRR